MVRREPDEELDHRNTRELKAKHYKLNISMPPGLFMQMEAARRKLDFGNGMSRSRFVAYCIGRYFPKKSPSRPWTSRGNGASRSSILRRRQDLCGHCNGVGS